MDDPKTGQSIMDDPKTGQSIMDDPKTGQAITVGLGGVALVGLAAYLLAGQEMPRFPSVGELGGLAKRELLPFGGESETALGALSSEERSMRIQMMLERARAKAAAYMELGQSERASHTMRWAEEQAQALMMRGAMRDTEIANRKAVVAGMTPEERRQDALHRAAMKVETAKTRAANVASRYEYQERAMIEKEERKHAKIAQLREKIARLRTQEPKTEVQAYRREIAIVKLEAMIAKLLGGGGPPPPPPSPPFTMSVGLSHKPSSRRHVHPLPYEIHAPGSRRS